MSVLKWQREHERVGRVFIRRKEDGEKLRVESAYFSNLDYRWYDIDGNVHPLYKKYQGQPSAVGFRIRNSDGKGNLVPFEGELKLTCKIGERGLVTQQIIEDGEKAIKTLLDKLSDHWGFKEVDQSVWMKKMRCHVVSACFMPGKTPDEYPVLNAIYPLWLFFDMLEDLNWPFNDLLSVSDVVLSVIRLDEDPMIPEDDPIKKTAIATASIYVDAFTRQASLDRDPFFDSLAECLEALCIKESAEWKEICSTKSERVHTTSNHLREITAAGGLAMEVLMLDYGCSLSKKVRSCFWYKMVMKSFNAHCSNSNDIFSYQKELASNTLNDNNVGCHVRNGDSLDTANSKVMSIVVSAYDDLQFFGGKLLDRFRGTPEYEEAEKVLEIFHKTIDGHLQLYPNVDRYHKDLTYDCIVDEISS